MFKIITVALSLIILPGCVVPYIEPTIDTSGTWDPWPTIPLKVYVHAKYFPYYQELDDAIEELNLAVGCEVFVRVEQDPYPDVVITYQVIPEDPAFADIRPRDLYGKQYAHIRLLKDGTPGEVMIALEHELGHALGLVHDRNGQLDVFYGRRPSLMAWNAVMFANDPRTKPYLTEADHQVLSEMYCR